ncbi:hypothetical protein B4U80_13683 [Leptotrombidium deliense]|uniref:W2 domain-containing protein n=1 Tax=Leptotrombidium deliense TaxID=299467 RepID=A0A443SLB5_9ACAR|nr:hypothetical protein B4U80_13683 [Leptotrombidium deliense]
MVSHDVSSEHRVEKSTQTNFRMQYSSAFMRSLQMKQVSRKRPRLPSISDIFCKSKEPVQIVLRNIENVNDEVDVGNGVSSDFSYNGLWVKKRSKMRLPEDKINIQQINMKLGKIIKTAGMQVDPLSQNLHPKNFVDSPELTKQNDLKICRRCQQPVIAHKFNNAKIESNTTEVQHLLECIRDEVRIKWNCNNYLSRLIESCTTEEERSDPEFVSEIIIAIIRGCIWRHRDSLNLTFYAIDTERLETRCNLIKKLCNTESKAEHMLNSSVALVAELEYPKGLLYEIFSILHSNALVSSNAILKWSRNEDKSVNKNIALLHLNDLITRLEAIDMLFHIDNTSVPADIIIFDEFARPSLQK